MKKIFLWIMTLGLLFTQASIASNNIGYPGSLQAPVPTTCVTGTFSKSRISSWANVSLKITNNCGRDVDFQNSSFTFINATNLNTSFWGNFSPLSYPDNPLMITSQASSGKYISSFSLHFPEQSWARSILHDKESISIQYGAASADYDASSFKAYINGTPPPAETGSIAITNASAKPTNVTQAYALVDIIFNGQKINTAQVPWSGSLVVNNLVPGSYTLQPQTVLDSQSYAYEGSAVPSTVTVVSNQQATSTISYKQVVANGAIKVKTPEIPVVIAGYTGQLIATLTRVDTGAAVDRNLPWNAVTTITPLDNNVTYKATAPDISYNNYRCTGSFNPTTLVSSSTNPPTTSLNYQCSTITADKVTINVTGLPCDISSIIVTFQPSDGSAKVTKTVSINNGTGSDFINLTDGVVYSVSATNVYGYNVLLNPQPLMAKPNVTLTVSYQPQAATKNLSCAQRNIA